MGAYSYGIEIPDREGSYPTRWSEDCQYGIEGSVYALTCDCP